MKTPMKKLMLCAWMTLGPGAPALAGIYDDPRNLEVLPKNVSPVELRNTMKGFALGLGARCEDCHAGKSGQPLETFDFKSDEKSRKKAARQMMTMVDDINRRYLSELDVAQGERVTVTCVTCHRGQLRPHQTHELLDQALTRGNLQAALAKYAELKQEYYGSHTFDFTELTLTEYARALAGRGRTADAIGIANLAAAEFSGSFMPHFLLGELLLLEGSRDAARMEFQRALELAPDQAWIKERLDSLKP